MYMAFNVSNVTSQQSGDHRYQQSASNLRPLSSTLLHVPKAQPIIDSSMWTRPTLSYTAHRPATIHQCRHRYHTADTQRQCSFKLFATIIIPCRSSNSFSLQPRDAQAASSWLQVHKLIVLESSDQSMHQQQLIFILQIMHVSMSMSLARVRRHAPPASECPQI